MNERIKKLRKALDLTQQKFADRIGIKGNAISQYESGRNEPIDAVISLICREFNVSEEWLRTGAGEMFVPSPNGVLDELVQKYGLSSRGKIIIERFLGLKPDIQEAVADYIEEVSAAFKDVFPAPPATGQERAQSDVAARVEELERQNKALAAKVAAMEEEDARMEAAAELSPGKPFSGDTKTG